MYAEGKRSLLICLQGRDAAGKDGTINHVLGAMNPQGCTVTGFKVPSKDEAAHDFLWRYHQHTPSKGQVAIFNRSHYEDVLVVRVHDLVPKAVWSKRYAQINDFEKTLADNGTHILKFYLHIDPEEQLERFKQRIDDPARHWKISDGDYAERPFWDAYTEAFEDAIEQVQHRACPLVHHPIQSQVVPQPRHLPHRRRDPRVAGHEVPGADGRYRGDQAEVPRDRAGGADRGGRGRDRRVRAQAG